MVRFRFFLYGGKGFLLLGKSHLRHFAKANIETQQLAGSCWFLTWPPIGTHVLYVTLEFSVILIFFWFLSILALILCWKRGDDLKRSATRACHCKYNSWKTTICLETVSLTTCRKEKMLENTKKDIFCTNYTLVARSTEKVTRMMCWQSSVTRKGSESVGRSFGRSVGQWVSGSVGRSVSHAQSGAASFSRTVIPSVLISVYHEFMNCNCFPTMFRNHAIICRGSIF